MDRFAKDRKAYQRMIFDIATLLSGPNAKPEEIQKEIDSLVAFEIDIIKVRYCPRGTNSSRSSLIVVFIT